MPLYPATPRRACPVCGHPAYSAGGIHPQCAQQRAEPTRTKRALKLPKTAADGPKPKQAKPWYLPCPRCGKPAHVRAKECGCGQVLRGTKTDAPS